MVLKLAKIIQTIRYDIAVIYRRLESLRFQQIDLKTKLNDHLGGNQPQIDSFGPPHYDNYEYYGDYWRHFTFTAFIYNDVYR